MKHKLMTVPALAASLLLAGCGGQDNPPSAPTAASESAALESPPAAVEMPQLEAPEALPPPPPGTPPEAAARVPVVVDAEGNPMSGLQIVQNAVEQYDRMRFASVEEDEKPWPELTSLTQILDHHILERLPAPPAGQRYVFDPATQKVSLQPQ